MIKVLREIIVEEIVKGRALDRYATMASRETINAIKDESVREAFNTNGRADFYLDAPEITDDIDYLRGIIIRLREGEHVASDGSYEFDLDASNCISSMNSTKSFIRVSGMILYLTFCFWNIALRARMS